MTSSNLLVGAALAGIKVLDVSGTVATGYCGKLFADHGATVIDLEPPGGFPTRYMAPWVKGAPDPERSAMHRWLSTNKSSVVLDLADAQGRDQLAALALIADVVLTAHSADDFASYLGATASEASRNAIVSHITWFGLTGPYRNFAGTDGVVQSLAGLVKGVGLPEGPPILQTGYQAQIVGGLSAFIGTMARVLARELGNDSGGGYLDTSIFEAALCFTEVGAVASFDLDLPRGKRLGINRLPPTYPLGVFPCKDGWMGLTVLTPSQWHAFCHLLALDDLAKVPAYQTAIGRFEHAHELEPRFRPKLLEWNAEDLFHRAQRARVPLALVPTMEQLFSIDQYVERGAFAASDHQDGRSFLAPVLPFRLYSSPARSGGRAPSLGEHSRQTLKASLSGSV